MQTGLAVFGLLSCILGCFCIAHAANTLWRRRWVWREAKRVRGKLIALKQCASGSDEPDFYTPVVRFCDHNECTHDIELLVTSNPQKYKIGNPIDVIYQASRPKNFIHAGSTGQEVLIVLINLGLGGMLMLVGVLALMGQIEVVST